MLSIDTADTRPIYLQIMDEVRRGIVLGTWRADEPLPSVRHLALELRVNPNTVQQAYRELERDGVVYTRRGQGTFVSAGDTRHERRALLRELAQRLLREAHRHGFTATELAEALTQEAARSGDTDTSVRES
jgi:GntR family transcriptional regulator